MCEGLDCYDEISHSPLTGFFWHRVCLGYIALLYLRFVSEDLQVRLDFCRRVPEKKPFMACTVQLEAPRKSSKRLS
jgi:hypothetical protein